jgi:hypothetical protein
MDSSATNFQAIGHGRCNSPINFNRDACIFGNRTAQIPRMISIVKAAFVLEMSLPGSLPTKHMTFTMVECQIVIKNCSTILSN